jgi:hypothetical protein
LRRAASASSSLHESQNGVGDDGGGDGGGEGDHAGKVRGVLSKGLGGLCVSG